MATGDRNVRHHHRHHHHQYQSAATTTFATLGSTIIGAGNDALAADCRRQVQRSECGRLAATVEVERFVVGDELLELTNLKLSDDPNDNETTSATAAAAEAAATKLNNNRHQHHRTTTSGHHHHNHQPPAPPLLLATTSSAGGGASSSSGSSASGRQQLLEEARAAVRRRTGDGGSGRKMLVAASANDAATGESPSPASRQAPAERQQQQQVAADSGCDHSTDLGAGSSTRAHEQPAFNQSLDSGVGHLSDASSNYSTTTTNANTTNYSHPHQSHHQQQHSNSSAMHQHQQQLVDFGSSGNYAPRNYALDFDSFYPSFSSDPSGQQRLMMSGDPSGSTSGARLVSMDAEFADLTYSSATSGGHFLGLEPASGATSTSERFKVQELGAFELSMVNSTQGQQSDGQQQHQLSHLHHLSYEPQAASYANLCPAGHYAITDMRPDSVIRLGYQQQQQLDGSETQQQHNRDPFQASHVSSQRPTDDEQQQQQPEIQLIEPHDISCLDSHANPAAGPMLLSQTTSSQHQPFSVSQHQASTANHLHLHTSQVSAHASHHQHQHQHQHHPQHHHHHHQHQLDNERELDQGLKVCEWEGCEHTFLDMQEFVKHLEDRHVNQEPREKNRYFCMWSNCKRNEQEFNARYKLLIHMRVHSGEKPYPCNNVNCKKSFSRLENLKIHQRSHTGEKPYKCNFDACSKSFTNSSDRIKHHKTHKDPKPYSCNFTDCTKRYTDPSSLRKHLRAHKRPPTIAGPGAPLPLMQVSGVHSQAQHSQHRLLSADFNPTLLLEPIGSKQQHPRSHLQLPGSNQEMYNQQQQHQHWQLSRSWCAGSTSSSSMHPTGASFGPPPPLPMNPGQMTHSGGQFSSSRLLADAPATPTYGGQLTDAGASNSHQHHLLHNQHQQRHHSQHLVATHETLMRSMPTQGFGGRRHAHASAAEWPPPARSGANEFRAPYVQPHALQQSLWSDGPQQQQQAHEQEDQHRQAH